MMMKLHDPLATAERLAPVPVTREEATVDAWVRHYAAQALAAQAAFLDAARTVPSSPVPGSKPELGYLSALAVASMHAAVALNHSADTPGEMWDLTPEAGALNGEWEDWLIEVLDLAGINPADIDPRYTASDFRSPARPAKEN